MRKVQSARSTELVKFTPAERDLIRRTALAVWNEIGYDALTSIGEMASHFPDEDIRQTMTRAEVMELVLDAGRLEDRIRDADLRTKVSNASYRQMQAIVRPAFTFSRYGL